MTHRITRTISQDERNCPRRKIKWQAAIKGKKYKQAIPAVTLNISAQGVYIETPVLFEIGEKLPIMITVDYFERYMVIYANTRVKHVVAKEVDCYAGLQFIKLNVTDREFLTRFAEGSI